jgi:hypothetical protein
MQRIGKVHMGMRMLTLAVTMSALGACGPTRDGRDDTSTQARHRTTAETSVPKTRASGATAKAKDPDIAGTTRIREIAGSWRVTGVEIAPGPVQAIVRDDPSLMGATLTISPEGMAWDTHGDAFDDVCPEPQIGPDGAIACVEGTFGPPRARMTADRGHMKLDWYDGAVVTLTRRDE